MEHEHHNFRQRGKSNIPAHRQITAEECQRRLDFYRKKFEAEQKAREEAQNIARDNPITEMLRVLEQLLSNNLEDDLLRAASEFCRGFELYMCDSKTMAGAQQLALKQYLYSLETSISPTHDPRQSQEFDLLKQHLAQMLQNYGYVPFAHRIKGVLKYIETYQLRSLSSRPEPAAQALPALAAPENLPPVTIDLYQIASSKEGSSLIWGGSGA